MLTQFREIRITLANIQNNMSLMLKEREQFIKEIEKLKKENEELRHKTDSEKSA